VREGFKEEPVFWQEVREGNIQPEGRGGQGIKKGTGGCCGCCGGRCSSCKEAERGKEEAS
jgi:hypothetical protein